MTITLIPVSLPDTDLEVNTIHVSPSVLQNGLVLSTSDDCTTIAIYGDDTISTILSPSEVAHHLNTLVASAPEDIPRHRNDMLADELFNFWPNVVNPATPGDIVDITRNICADATALFIDLTERDPDIADVTAFLVECIADRAAAYLPVFADTLMSRIGDRHLLGLTDEELTEKLKATITAFNDNSIKRHPKAYLSAVCNGAEINKIGAMINRIVRPQTVAEIKDKFRHFSLDDSVSDEELLKRFSRLFVEQLIVPTDIRFTDAETFLNCLIDTSWWLEVPGTQLVTSLYRIHRTAYVRKGYDHIPDLDKDTNERRVRANAAMRRSEILLHCAYLILTGGGKTAIAIEDLQDTDVIDKIVNIIKRDALSESEETGKSERYLSLYLRLGTYECPLVGEEVEESPRRPRFTFAVEHRLVPT